MRTTATALADPPWSSTSAPHLDLGPECFELFRGALVDRDAAAWEALYERCQPLVRLWARRVAGDPDEVESIVNAAFTRLWRAVDATKFASFRDLSSLLRYVKLCVHSVALDHRRARAAWSCTQPWETEDEEHRTIEPAARDDVERETLDDESRAELWLLVRHCLPDSRERLLVRLSFVESLPPREICARYPEQFASVADVYRLKATIFERLRRQPALQSWWQEYRA